MRTALAWPLPGSTPISRQDLLRALAQDEFVLAYQPTVNLVDQTVTGLEALARWVHPRLGLLSAARFIPLAERYGIIREIDDWVFRTACRQLANWQEDVLVSPELRMAWRSTANIWSIASSRSSGIPGSIPTA